MERMDGARRVGGLAWVLIGVLFGAGWAVAGTVPGVITLALVAAVLGLAALVAYNSRTGGYSGVTRGWARFVALLLGADFAGAVADRFGAFGPPGGPGVSWGSWTAFVDYTRMLLHGIPEPAAVAAAAGATATEVALAVALALGWQRRWVGKAAAGLLMFYLVAMASSVGWSDVARYALPIEIGGALLLTVCPATPTAGHRPLSNPRRGRRAHTPDPQPTT